jgi:hypothetical protein
MCRPAQKPENEAPENDGRRSRFGEGTTMASRTTSSRRHPSAGSWLVVSCGAAAGTAAGSRSLLRSPCAAAGWAPRFENNQQPHLGTWLQRHGNLSPEQQERALQSEPGFNRLPPETQQKLLNRLRQINRMPPEQRQRTVDRIEAMEHLTPQMRQQVRASVQDFRALPRTGSGW